MPQNLKNSVLTDNTNLTDVEKEIFELVFHNWPSTALEIAEHFKEDLSTREAKTRASTKYSYYLKKLVEKKFLFSKKAGNALIVWPIEVEKYRTMHNIFRGDIDA